MNTSKKLMVYEKISFEDFCDLMVDRGYMTLENSIYAKKHKNLPEISVSNL